MATNPSFSVYTKTDTSANIRVEHGTQTTYDHFRIICRPSNSTSAIFDKWVNSTSAQFYQNITDLSPSTTYVVNVGYAASSGVNVTWIGAITFTTDSEPTPTQTWTITTANYGQISSTTTKSFSTPARYILCASFSVPTSGTVKVYTTGSTDTVGFISSDTDFNDSDGSPTNIIADDDDSGDHNNFSLTFNATANVTYYVWVRGYFHKTQFNSANGNIVIEPPQLPSFTATVENGDTIAVTIKPVSGFPNYRIYIRENVTGSSLIYDEQYTGKTSQFTQRFYSLLKRGTEYLVNVGYSASTSYQNLTAQTVYTTPIGSIRGEHLSSSQYSVTASGMQVNPSRYYSVFVADLDTNGNITGYYCRLSSKVTSNTWSATYSTSSSYSKYNRPIYLVYSTSAFSVGTKYTVSWFNTNALPYSISSYVISPNNGIGIYIYANKNGVFGWYQAIPFVYSGGWKQADAHIFSGGWN